MDLVEAFVFFVFQFIVPVPTVDRPKALSALMSQSFLCASVSLW